LPRAAALLVVEPSCRRSTGIPPKTRGARTSTHDQPDRDDRCGHAQSNGSDIRADTQRERYKNDADAYNCPRKSQVSQSIACVEGLSDYPWLTLTGLEPRPSVQEHDDHSAKQERLQR
jgi:hypothetical protein